MKKIISWIKQHKSEFLLVVGLLGVAALSHGYNMLHYPYYESDEGTYLSQAWAVLAKGKLAPYTYWYDHAPVGWFFVALWLVLTGGVFTFGFSLNSGRVFMLVLHVLSSLLLYLFARKITGSKIPGVIAVLLFSLSPVGVYFQRRLLLDNIMMFWLFVSLNLIVYSQKKLRTILLGGIAAGIAVLSKESAIFFFPILVYLVSIYSDKRNRSFALLTWLTVALSIVGMYFLYSLLKGELFPTGSWLGGTNEHVSLLGTLKFQAGRGKISIFDPKSSFWSMFHTWKGDDPFLLLSGSVATVVALLYGIRKRAGLIIGGLTLCYWVFLMRGGLVLEFYVIPLIPLLGLCIGYIVWQTVTWVANILPENAFRLVPWVLCLPVIYLASTTMYYHANHFRATQKIYSSDETTAQQDAVNWILARKEPNLFYAIDNYAYLELKLKNEHNFAHADYYWKVDGDKDIKTKILHDNPLNIDYILFTPTIGGDLGTGELKMMGKAISKSEPVTSFTGDGWYVQIWGVKNANRILTSAWNSYKVHFMQNGRVFDPQQHNLTTSEGQSYALLRSVWMGDKNTFDQVLHWTNTNLRQRNELFAWKWQQGKIIDSGTAPDADEDIALALLFAYKAWGEKAYLQQAQAVIAAIWNTEVISVQDMPILTAGDWAIKSMGSTVTINPSYFSPASYRIFAQVDPSHPWTKLSDSSYEILQQCTQATFGGKSGVLPPEWCAVSTGTGQVSQPPNEPRAVEYGYNAFRIPWRVGLDWQWNHTPQAKAYLQQLSFLGNEWNSQKKLITAYTHTGEKWENYESVAAYAGNIGYFSVVDPRVATTIYTDKIEKKFFEDRDIAYWDDPNNYYTQNWGWFGTALYTNKLKNYWTQ